MTDASETSLDLQFSVPFVHRLRVTDDVSREDFRELLAVMESGDAACAKVLLIAEQALSDPTDRIVQQLEQSDCVQLVCAPVLVQGGEEIKNSSDTVDLILNQINQLNQINHLCKGKRQSSQMAGDSLAGQSSQICLQPCAAVE